jgi:hypothetical protein
MVFNGNCEEWGEQRIHERLDGEAKRAAQENVTACPKPFPGCPTAAALRFATDLGVGEVRVLDRPGLEHAGRKVRAGGHGALERGPVEAGVLERRAPEVAPLEAGPVQERLVEPAPLKVAPGKVGALGDDFVRARTAGRAGSEKKTTAKN